jgi:choline kinase
MRALILAAGQGTRLAPYTDDRPKGLVEIGGRSIVKHLLDNLAMAGIDDISILTGYMSEMFTFEGINYVHNNLFASTNMVYTLFCAEHLMDEELIVSYGDIIFEPYILKRLTEDKGDISIVIDNEWRRLWELRHEDPLNNAETLKLNADGTIREIGAKPGGFDEIESQYIGLMKFSPEGLRDLKEVYRKLGQEPPEQEIIRGRKFNEIYMTDILQILIDEGIKASGVVINGGWIEVDSAADYEMYCEMYESGKLKDYCNIGNIASG